MSAAVNDRPHEIVPVVHLPLTGELHPLRREFARWLATGNMITITLALVTCASIYFWPREAPGPVVNEFKGFIKEGVFHDTPVIVEHTGGGGSPDNYSVIAPFADFEPTKDKDPVTPESIEPPGGIGDGEDPSLNGPITNTFSGGPPIDIDPPAPKPSDGFNPFDTEPVLLSIDPPVYPNMVKDAGIDGTVLVRVFIKLDGHIKDAYVIEGSPALREAALASARTAFFKPARQGTHPVEVWVVIPITFKLHDRD